jgi:hypothetical protein
MRRLMSQEASSPEIHDEPKALFQKLISLSQGSEMFDFVRQEDEEGCVIFGKILRSAT